MQELALSDSIVELLNECAAWEGKRGISRVVVEIGIAAAVEPEALAYCFPIAAAETLAVGAELVVRVKVA